MLKGRHNLPLHTPPDNPLLSSSLLWYVAPTRLIAYHRPICLGVCGTDQHIHHVSCLLHDPQLLSLTLPLRESSSPNSQYVFSAFFTGLRHRALSQLIPGHEAIGSIVKMGKNVQGFELGDRCVADVGITVGSPLFRGTLVDSFILFCSVKNVFTVAEASHSSVRTSSLVASPAMAASQNTSSSNR